MAEVERNEGEDSHMKQPQLSFLVAVVAIGVLAFAGMRALAFTFIPPSDPPGVLPATFDLPLNTSGVTQIKAGPLTVNGTFTVTNSLNVNGDICWNGSGINCRSNWQNVGSTNFVHRYPSIGGSDFGYPHLVGQDESEAALTSTAGDPSGGRWTQGVYGAASTEDTGDSYGVVGEALSDNTYAVYGMIQSGQSAWAGYFVGNVRIFSTVGSSSPADLVIGPIGANVQTARTNSISEICLGDDPIGGPPPPKPFAEVCKSDWPPGTTSKWALNPLAQPNATLWPASSDLSLAAGGSDASAKFLVQRQPDGTADLAVQGDTALKKMVIGTPVNLPVTATCGDGICNNSENDNYCSPRPCGNYCPEDCDLIPPDNLSVSAETIDESTGVVTFVWNNPPQLDYAGVRVVSSTNLPPSGPDYGTPIDLPNSQTSYTTPPHGFGTLYYYTFYSFDGVRNYAAGETEHLYFSDPSDPPGGPLRF